MQKWEERAYRRPSLQCSFILTIILFGLTLLAFPKLWAQQEVVRFSFTNIAGIHGGSGSVDGLGSAARFKSPAGVTADDTGNLYVADTFNCTIRMVTPSGTVTTLAGLANNPGTNDGPIKTARFTNPTSVSRDKEGNLYVAEPLTHTIRKVSLAGVVTTVAGLARRAGTNDGAGSNARFKTPTGLAVDGAANVYVADVGNYTIRRISPGGIVTTLAGMAGKFGTNDGLGSSARFGSESVWWRTWPTGIAIDAAGDLYVLDAPNRLVRKVTSRGLVTTVAGGGKGPGIVDGVGSFANFSQPAGIALDSRGIIYLTDLNQIRQVTPDRVVTTLAGMGTRGSADGSLYAAQFSFPKGIAVDRAGIIYVADTDNHTIRKISSDGIVTTLAGRASNRGDTDGSAITARFRNPAHIAVDLHGTVYVSDNGNHKIKTISPSGIVTTLAGGPDSPTIIDSNGKISVLAYPSGLAVDGKGNTYVACVGSVQKITSGGVVTTLVHSSGSYSDRNNSRRFQPSGVALYRTNLLVTDVDNHTILSVTLGGSVSVLAGEPGVQGRSDGTGTGARFYSPGGVAADQEGNVYVSDTYNHTIRKITPDGQVSTVAGQAGDPGKADGTGMAARFDYPKGIVVVPEGSLYVADGSRIRKISPEGYVTTLARTAISGEDMEGSREVTYLSSPFGLAVDAAGNLYIADPGNNRLVKGTRSVRSMSLPRIDRIETDRSGELELFVEAMGATSNDLIVETSEPVGSQLQWYVETSAFLGVSTDVPGNFTIGFESPSPLSAQLFRIRIGD